MISRQAEPYWKVVEAELPRILSWQDREAHSQTYGCFDRTFWCWKFTDFAGARFQEGVYALAHLLTTEAPGNLLYSDPRAAGWIEAGLDYWLSLQYSDGSFDEAYPCEHSLAATAFTAFYVAEAVERLGDALTAGARGRVVEGLARAATWLCLNDERHGLLSNHLAAAAAGLDAVYRLTHEDRHLARSRYFVERILAHQSEEGWYEEYGGADPGYQTHATFYLARIWQRSRDERLLASLRQSLAFLAHFVHPDGTLGGEYASRNTEFYFPAGIELLAAESEHAAAIARFMRRSVAARRTVGPWAMDAQNYFPLLNNYLFAAQHAVTDDAPAETLPCERPGEWYFPRAGLLVLGYPAYHAVLGLSKGGVLRVYERSRARLAFSDCGYWARGRSGVVATSQSLSLEPDWRRIEGGFRIERPFALVNQRVFTPLTFIAFRCFTLTLGRLPFAAYWIKNLLVSTLVRRRALFPLVLERSIRWSAEGVSLGDRLTRTANIDLVDLRRGAKFSAIHMGSSRYFQPAELALAAEGELCDGALASVRAGRAELERRWHPGEDTSE